MKTKMMSATALALVLAAGPALAANDPARTANTPATVHSSTQANINTGTAGGEVAATLNRAADSISDLAQGVAPEAKVNLHGLSTVKAMLGQDIQDLTGKKIADVEDLLLRPDGQISKVILSNGGIMGVGAKLVAVDYSLVYQSRETGDVVMPLSDSAIKGMTAFSYDPADTKDGAVTLGADMLSAKELLAGKVVDAAGKQVADVRDLTLANGKTQAVIAAYKQTLGFGGHLFSVPYASLTKADVGSRVDVKMDANLMTRFDSFTRSVN